MIGPEAIIGRKISSLSLASDEPVEACADHLSRG